LRATRRPSCNQELETEVKVMKIIGKEENRDR